MSDSKPRDTSSFRLRLPPVETLVVFVLAAAMLGVCAIQFRDLHLLQLLLMAVFFVVGILAKRAWAIYIMLGIFIFLHYLVIHPSLKQEFYHHGFPDIFLVSILILLGATCFRFLEAHRFLQSFYPNARLVGEKPKPGTRNEFPSLLGGRWWAIPLAVVMASGLLTVFPFGVRFFQQARLQRQPSRLIFFTLILFFGWLICRALVGIFIRWRMKKVQADVQCRSLIAKEMWKDVYPVEKRRAKILSQD